MKLNFPVVISFITGVAVGCILSFYNFKSPDKLSIKVPDAQTAAINMSSNVKKNTAVAVKNTNEEINTVNNSLKTSNNSNLPKLPPQKIFSGYTNYIEYCVRKNWSKYKIDTNDSFSLDFNIRKDGKVDSYGILSMAKNKKFQNDAVKAFLDCNPFEPFPEGMGKEIISYQIHFNGYHINLGSYAKIQTLPNIVKDKPIIKNTLKIEKAKDVRTMSSFPSKYSYVSVGMDVQRNWNPPVNENSQVQISYDINEKGQVVNVRVVNSSGPKEAVNAAIKALKSAKPKNVKEYVSGLNYWFYVEDYRW